MTFKKDPFQIMCVNCRALLYWYYGTFEGAFDKENFKPAHPKVPVPDKKTKMLCPECVRPFYMVNFRGGPIFMTNRGWKPREPSGPSRIFMPGEEHITINNPKIETEYKEP